MNHLLDTATKPFNRIQCHDMTAATALSPQIFFGAALLEAGKGGIARVARLTAQFLTQNYDDLAILSYLDKVPVSIGGHAVARARSGKVEFVARCLAASLNRTHFVFDSAGLARSQISVNPWHRPCAIWMHGIEVWELAKPPALAALSVANLILVKSHFTLARHEALHGPRPQAKVCWLATEDDIAPVSVSPRNGPPTAFILGRIDELEGYKGHAELIACWPSVRQAVPDARLVIAGGGGGLSALKSLVARSPVAHAIDCLGFVPEAEIDSIWRRAHVLAMPSRKEGFGLVYVEAMRHGLPVIASVQDAGSEVNIHGQTGLNVDLNKRDDLPRALIEVLRAPDRARRMGEAGFRRWQTEFNYSAFARRLQPILTEFLGTPGRPR